MLNLKTFRQNSLGFADLLNFACLPSPGVLLGKDGSLSAFYMYSGHDMDSSSPEELATLSARVNAVFSKFGNGWMIKTDVIRRSVSSYPMPEKAFSHELPQKIDDERRSLFNSSGTQFESLFLLSITFLPPYNLESKFYKFLIEGPKDQNQNTGDHLASKHIELFEKNLSLMEQGLSSVIALRRLKNYESTTEHGTPVIFDEVLEFLNYLVTGRLHPVRLPHCPMYIDSILAYDDFIGGFKPQIGQKKIAVLSIDGFPLEGEPAILSSLSKLTCEYRWNSRFIFMDREEARKNLEGFRKRWKQKVRGFRDQIFQTAGGRVDEHALMQVGEVDSALALVESGSVSFGFYTSVIIILNENEEVLRENKNQIQKAVTDLGFSCREEKVNAVESWLGSLPSHSAENVRRPVLHTLNLADLLPMSTIWSGEEFNPHPKWHKNSPPLFQAFTDGNTAFRGSIHVSDIGHFLVIGPTGGGKSLLLNFLDAQFLRYKKARIFAFDKKYSKFGFCMGADGIHYDLNHDDKHFRLCPLAHIGESESEKSWAKEWILSLCKYQGLSPLPEHTLAVHEAIEKLSKSQVKSLTDFNATVQNQDIRNVVSQFTLNGSIPLLDGSTDEMVFSTIQVIELDPIMSLKSQNALPILEYLFHKIERSIDGSPVLLTIDEAWIALQHPAFRGKIKQWLKEMRSKNVAVGLATQSISDAEKSGILDDIIESCPTKIFTANPNAESEESRQFYKKIGLTSQQIAIIANLIPKRQYYFMQPQGQRVIDLGVGDYALKWLGAGDTETILKLKSLIQEYPDTWKSKWEEIT